MAGGAAGGFVARAFESMLKECANKKYSALLSAIQTYLDSGKDFNQQSNIGETKQILTEAPKESESSESNSGAEKSEKGPGHSNKTPSTAEDVEPRIRTMSSGSATTALEIAGHTLGEAEADLVLNPLRLAFETKNIKVVELALDCLHKLIEYNHLEGDPGLDGGKNSKLLTDILDMVCSCVDNSAPDSTTLQVLKVLLTAIASTKIRVHRDPLLGIIRVCFNIALNSKSPINQATSKAMLTQMLSIIFGQMETEMVSSNSLETKHALTEDGPDLRAAEVSCHHNDPKMNSDDILSVKHFSKTSVLSIKGIQDFAGGADIKGLETILKNAVDHEDVEKVESSFREMGPERISIEQRDALLIFYTLFKMGMKEGNDELTTNTRILSLELLQSALEEVGSSSAKNFQLIDSIRAHLSYALLRASVSRSPALFQCTTGILSVLLLRFRESLKAEIGVFFPLIVLRSLDGSDLNQKLIVLRMLEKICKDPQMLVDLYVNYDCDIEAPNLFERMVAILSKITQGTQNVDPKSSTASQTLSVKTSSLQGLVNILKSLVIWEKSHRKSEKQNMESFDEVSLNELDESKSKEDSPNNLEKLNGYKSTIEAAVSEPGKGIEHLITSQLGEKTPALVAQFLRSMPDLDKAMIGDYLGQNEEFPIAVMHAYVESMNFSGLKFDFAIHEFLKGFRLPGEAQKIDRIMEKFAERYCADNPGLFKNADTAYVLAYTVIMLIADAHSPTGWQKMSKSDFIHLNATYSAENRAPKKFLEEIYDNIVKEEITMKDGSEAEVRGHLVSVLNLAYPKRSSSTDSKSESEAILKQIQSINKDQGGNLGVFYTSHRIEHVRPMVEVVGWPLLATFSVTMGEADSTMRFSICMEGFKEGIHLTLVLGMDTIRYAFLTSLLRYNFLHAPRDMRGKNVEALKTLLELCDTDIYALQDSWLAVLECISRLEYLVSSPTMTASLIQGSNQISRDAMLHSLRELSGKPTEQVFINSAKLPSESVVEFFNALCNVSAEELKQTPARTFSLLKIVETSYYNMARIRMVWARIWSVMTQHFIFAGSHADEKVAIYAIDSLQRLVMKYLDHAELASFTFQEDILKPYVLLMQSSRSESIRRFILDGAIQMIKSKAGIVKSGWRSVFMIFSLAANDALETIVESAFENIEQVILEHFNHIAEDCFMDCANCLIGYANNKSSVSISLKAIALLHICEDRLAEGLVPVGSPKLIDITADKSCSVAERYWFPMLSGLSDLISDPRSEVSNCALEVLFDLLNERGSKFSSSFWEKIFQQVLFPIFDLVRHSGNESSISSGDEWLRESTVHALQLLCDLFNAFYKDVYFMLPPLLSLLLDCAKKTDQSVVSIALGALVHLIEVGGHQFSSEDWGTLLKSVRDAVYTTQPLELLNDLGFENQKHHKLSTGERGSSSPASGNLLHDHHHPVHTNGNAVGALSLTTNGDENTLIQNQETVRLSNEGSQGLPSPSSRGSRPSDTGSLQRNQTLGQKIMGNMRSNIFVRTFTSKPVNFTSDAVVLSSPSKLPDVTMESEAQDEEESPVLGTIRSKCMTQLLLLGAIDGIQKKYWNKLKAQEKTTVMEILFSILEFAASYNSYTNLRLRMHQILEGRPPMNLLRQELTGTCIYLDILQKTTATINIQNEEAVKEEKVERVAKEKLVSFCEQVLREASDFQSSMEETTNMDIHRVLELRSPVLVKVLKSMCEMNPQIFKDHLRDFYPSMTKLVCSDQLEVRGALADLLSTQLSTLVQ